MAGHRSKPLRGLESTKQSSTGTGTGTARFGRMFRWLDPAQSPQGGAEDTGLVGVLQGLAARVVTIDFEDNLAKGKPKADTPFTEPEPEPEPEDEDEDEDEDENPTIAAGYTDFSQFIDTTSRSTRRLRCSSRATPMRPTTSARRGSISTTSAATAPTTCPTSTKSRPERSGW